MTAIKICGLSTLEHALAAATAGADLLGLVFATSRRQVTPDQAATLIAALRQHPAGARVRLVGLFVNEHPARINALADYCQFDYVQLSGDETPRQAAGIVRPVIKALRLNQTPGEEEWLHLVSADQSNLSQTQTPWMDEPGRVLNLREGLLPLAPCSFIVDAHVPGSYGGTGTLANWDHAATLARHQRLLLAGGLTPDNVAAAIAQVQPWGVDVSSGVEIEGRKDHARIEAFIRAARAAACPARM